jgi:hypothetical protein
MIGALDEAALGIANANEPGRETAEARTVIHNLIDGLLRDSPPDHPDGASDGADSVGPGRSRPTPLA